MNRLAQFLPSIERGSPTWWAWVLLAIGLCLGFTCGTLAGSIARGETRVGTDLQQIADDLQERIQTHEVFNR